MQYNGGNGGDQEVINPTRNDASASVAEGSVRIRPYPDSTTGWEADTAECHELVGVLLSFPHVHVMRTHPNAIPGVLGGITREKNMNEPVIR